MAEGPEKDNIMKSAAFLEIIFNNNTLISLSMSSSGAFPYNLALGFRDWGNGKFFRGIKNMLTKVKAPKLPIDEEKK